MDTIDTTLKKTSQRIFERETDTCCSYRKDESNRMASTIRHNRARGSHSIELMSTVDELVKSGIVTHGLLKHIGMDKDELLRLKQITGLASLFNDKEFSDGFNKE
jgi:ParB-like chromosome segregation protein Spo0J